MGIPVFSIDLLIFQICQTFQAQDRTCMSFFLVDLLSKHFDSVSKMRMFAFLVDLMNFQIFQAHDRRAFGRGSLVPGVLTVFLRHVISFFLIAMLRVMYHCIH